MASDAREASLIARREEGFREVSEGLPADAVEAVQHAALESLAARAGEYVEAARAAATRRAYQSDWAEFTGWAQPRGLAAMPAAPATVALYLTDLAELAKTSTVERRLAFIVFAHRAAGCPSPTDDPTVKAVWAGIRRVHGTAADQAAPLTVSLLRRAIAAFPPGPGGTRDAALLLVGFAGAGTGPWSSPAATSAAARSSGTMPPLRSGCRSPGQLEGHRRTGKPRRFAIGVGSWCQHHRSLPSQARSRQGLPRRSWSVSSLG